MSWGKSTQSFQGVKSGGLEGVSGKEGTRRDGAWREEHSVLLGVKSGGLVGVRMLVE